jgi:hypothetical protein
LESLAVHHLTGASGSSILAIDTSVSTSAREAAGQIGRGWVLMYGQASMFDPLFDQLERGVCYIGIGGENRTSHNQSLTHYR